MTSPDRRAGFCVGGGEMEYIEHTQHLDTLDSSAETTLVTGVRRLDNDTLIEYQYVKKDGIIVVSILDSDTLFKAIRNAEASLRIMTKLLKRKR